MHTRSKAFRSTLQVMAGIVALALVLTSGRASCWAATQPAAAATASDPVGSRSAQSETAAASSPAAGTPASTADGYAAREAQAKDLENFRGGDVVIIGSTGVIIVLLVLLIIVIA
jgi:hypothetical protein